MLSNFLSVVCGVPQGSILGPTLFLLYINDLHNVSEMFTFILFAGDTNICCTGKDLKEICDTLSQELKRLDVWFKVNKLSLNVSKTNFIVFSNIRYDDCSIQINDTSIERVYFTKFLGVYIDSKLSWEHQIKHIQNKIAKSISIMYKVKYLLTKSALYTLYCALILPYLNYCCEIWGNNYFSNIKNIVILQKKAVRIIDQAPYRAHTNIIFKKYTLLKFSDIVKLSSCIIMYKAKNNMLPCRLTKLFDINTGKTRQAGKFLVKYSRTRKKGFCISSIGVKLWNQLENDVVNSRSLIEFKKRYKKSVLKSY